MTEKQMIKRFARRRARQPRANGRLNNKPVTFTDYELQLRGVLQEAIRAFPQFDTESEEVSGADLVEWFAEWRKSAITAIYRK